MNSNPASCPICGSNDHSLYLAGVYALEQECFDLLRCSGCGLVFVHPRPDIETLRKLYTESYFHCDFSCGVRKGSYLETEASRVEEYRETLSQIQEFKTSGRFLEVGCAAGSFLNYARRSGFEVTGVDISSWAAETARNQFGLDIREGRLVETGLPDKHFDVVFLGDLLEHEPEPLYFLAEIRRVLKGDGVLAVKVPVYVNSFYYRLARHLPWSWTMGILDPRLLESLKLSDYTPRLPPYHLYEYSPATLKMLLNKAGFRVVKRSSSLLVPEFLKDEKAGLTAKAALAGFLILRFLIKILNIHGGHITVFAVKSGDHAESQQPGEPK